MATVRFPKPEVVLSQQCIEIISSNFGMHIDFHHFERMQLLNLNSEVDFQRYDRHLQQETHQKMRYSERELSLQPGKTTVFDRHEIRLRVKVSSLAIRFGSLSYDDIVQAVQNTIDLCINSATDRHGHLAHLYRTPNPYRNQNIVFIYATRIILLHNVSGSLVLGGVCRSATAAEFRSIHDGILSILTLTAYRSVLFKYNSGHFRQ